MEKKELPCDVVQDLLDLYVDKAVKETTREMVAKHLEQCEECNEIYEQLNVGVEFVDTIKKEEKASFDRFENFTKRLKKTQVIKRIITAIIAVALTAGFFFFASTADIIPGSDKEIKINKTYVVSYFGKDYLFVVYSNFPNYTNGMRWSSEVMVNKDGVGNLKYDIKHPLLSKKGERFERFETDYSAIEGGVPNEIQFNGEVIWSKRDNENDTIPEFVQYYIAGNYEIVDFNGDYYDMTLSDGKHLYWDENGNEVDFMPSIKNDKNE